MADTTETIKKIIANKIIETGGFDSEKRFVNIDTLWQDPYVNKIVTHNISQYILNAFPPGEIQSLITFDTVAYPFGPSPLAASISMELCLPLSIIKEADDPILGKHRLYGAEPHGNILLLYDVTLFGLTAVRLIHFLYKMNIKPKYFLTIIDSEKGALSFLNDSAKNKIGIICNFSSILKLSEIVASIPQK